MAVLYLLIVIAKLIIPYTPPVNLTSHIATLWEHNKTVPTNTKTANGNADTTFNDMKIEEAVMNVNHALHAQYLQFYIVLIWISVGVMLFMRKLSNYFSFVTLIRKNSKAIVDNVSIKSIPSYQVLSLRRTVSD